MSMSSVTNFYIKIETQLAVIEYRLGEAARLPVVPGVAKVLVGTIQAIIALSVALFCSMPAICSKNARFIFFRSIAHIGHGFGNIAAGLIEAVPIAGYISAVLRDRKNKDNHPRENFIRYKHQNVCLEINDQSSAAKELQPNETNKDKSSKVNGDQLQDTKELKPNETGEGKSSKTIKNKSKGSKILPDSTSTLALFDLEWDQSQNAYKVTCANTWVNRMLYTWEDSQLEKEGSIDGMVLYIKFKDEGQSKKDLSKLLSTIKVALNEKYVLLSKTEKLTVEVLKANEEFAFKVGNYSCSISGNSFFIFNRSGAPFDACIKANLDLQQALDNTSLKYKPLRKNNQDGVGRYEINQSSNDEIQFVIDALYSAVQVEPSPK